MESWVAVAVGALHHHDVRVVRFPGIPKDRHLLAPDVTAVDEFPLASILLVFEQAHRGPQHMACILEGELRSRRNGNRHPVGNRDELLHDLVNVFFIVEGRNVTPLFLGKPLGISFLDVGAVQEHDRAEVPCGMCRVDRSLVSVPRQDGQQAAVVDVRVAQHDRVEALPVEREILVLGGGLFAPALEHPAIEENASSVDFHDVFAAGDAFRGAVRGDSHGIPFYLQIARGSIAEDSRRSSAC